ncbi:hypothetical protein KKC44_06140 [Patescibacteria group bacterium]|nr:hypothetical protein [Patescibacteria group bacterium]MBU2260151.1 hypothetical protein [Patescibacteria group bacterium]
MPIETDTGIGFMVNALSHYMQETHEHYAICDSHEKTTAIHTQGKSLQVYKQFDSKEDVAKSIREKSKTLRGWEALPEWKYIGSTCKTLQKGIEARMRRHTKQHPVLTRGVLWEGKPVLIHSYKFEPDPIMKNEILVPETEIGVCELSLKVIASVLRCHDFLVPPYVAIAKPPYESHDANFMTISEYLSKTMPQNMYTSQCFPQKRTEFG